MTALFFPYIAQERTAQSAILSVRSERFALCLKERHRSQNQGSLKSEERKRDFKERCAQLWSEPLRIWIFSVALILVERHRSQNKGSLKSEERLSDFKELCAQLWVLGEC